MKRFTKAVSAVSIVAGLMLVGTGVAHAEPNPVYLGEANCLSWAAGYKPGTQLTHWGTARHQISPGVGYYEKSVNLGLNPGISRFKIAERAATWATMVTDGGDRVMGWTWDCRAASWS